MNFGIYSYLATTLIFPGLAMALYFAVRKKYRLTPIEHRVIKITSLITLAFTTVAEGAALSWNVWTYSPLQTLHTRFLGAEIETYLYIALVSLVVCLATVSYARHEDRDRS